MLHDGTLHAVPIPELTVPRCAHCGELVFGIEACTQISQALRDHLHLLSPEQIRGNRQLLGLSRRDLAEQLRITEELLGQWEDGLVIQSGLADRALRGCFAVPAYRAALVNMARDPAVGTVVVS
jgi:DNA-binding transcriptional regulator YiaG